MRVIDNDYLNGIRNLLETAITQINIAQEVDAVTVVRCKDCKHCEEITTIFGKDLKCCLLHIRVLKDFYCKAGEKK